MPRYFIDENGDVIFRSKYSHDGAFRIEDIFGNNYRSSSYIKMKSGHSWKDYGISRKHLLAHMIFYDFLIELFVGLSTGGMFEFPGKSGATISLKSFGSKAIDKFLDYGLITERQLQKAGGKWPYFEFHYGPKFRRKPKMVKVPKWIQDMANKNAVEGKINWRYYTG
jgi:hypothetical protein